MPSPRSGTSAPTVAVLIPCYNEATTIGPMLDDLKTLLPAAQLIVADNNSSDTTATIARKHGALVLHEPRQGKGYAVQRLFSAADADIYVLIDGDATYDLPSLPKLIAKLQAEHLAMLIGIRVPHQQAAYRAGHRFGNRLLTGMLGLLFKAQFTDILSGYRIFSRAFVKSFPINTGGFTIESALTVHALQLGLPCAEVATPYYARPAGSHSKLNTYRDGLRISTYIARLFVTERPLVFYGLVGIALALLGVAMFVPLLTTYLHTGLVPRMPTLIVTGSLGIGALLCAAVGLILQAVRNTRLEAKQLAYLAAR